MTEHNHDSHGGGGHEVDQPPTRELFNIIWGLTGLTLLSLVTCVQLFNNQARDLTTERGDEGSYLLSKYRKDMETRTVSSGKEQLTDVTGKVVARYDYIPLASARDLILAKPEKLGAFAPPPGWIHPDDVAAGGQGGAPAPAPVPVPVPVPAPPEGAPLALPPGVLPAGGAPIGAPAGTGSPAPGPATGSAPAPATGSAPAPATGSAPAPAVPAPAPAAPTPAPASAPAK